MDYMYSPWRNMSKNNLSKTSPKRCIFCEIASNLEKEKYLLYSDDICFVVMNLYPYSSGHILLVPKKHQASIVDFSQETLVAY